LFPKKTKKKGCQSEVKEGKGPKHLRAAVGKNGKQQQQQQQQRSIKYKQTNKQRASQSLPKETREGGVRIARRPGCKAGKRRCDAAAGVVVVVV
jgi:hypothetical protein